MTIRTKAHSGRQICRRQIASKVRAARAVISRLRKTNKPYPNDLNTVPGRYVLMISVASVNAVRGKEQAQAEIKKGKRRKRSALLALSLIHI